VCDLKLRVLKDFLQKNPKKMQQFIKILLFLILNEALHVSGNTPPIIRSLKTAQAASGFA